METKKSDMNTVEEIRQTMSKAVCTTAYHQLGLSKNIMATDGVRSVCEKAECHWLFDIIVSHLVTKRTLSSRPFQVWRLRMTPDDPKHQAVVEAFSDLPGGAFLAKQAIPMTDFPLPDGITFWVERTADHKGKVLFVVLLPSEH